MPRELSLKKLEALIEARRLEGLSYDELRGLFLREEGLRELAPPAVCQTDPRSGDRVLFNPARAKRPHDLPEGESQGGQSARKSGESLSPCVVCEGKTTGVVDVAELSEGRVTFINKNLYPILFPDEEGKPRSRDPLTGSIGPRGERAVGFHFLQWTSSAHDQDWPEMRSEDRRVVVDRLAVLEERLLKGATHKMPSAAKWGGPSDCAGFVSVIKNHGQMVGGSIEHSHQQIAFSNVMPARFQENWDFLKRYGETFNRFLQRENPSELTVKDYGAARLVVPYFMRRPFNMIWLLKDDRKRFFHELSAGERMALAEGWSDGIALMRKLLRRLGRSEAFNIVCHTGPGAGLYMELLPYTQETGGFEHLGLWVCQGDPGNAAETLRALLGS